MSVAKGRERYFDVRCQQRTVLSLLTMEQNMILINREEVEGMIRHMNRAIGYCKNARSSYSFDPQTDIEAEPTEFYSGASGFALSTLQSVIRQLEYSLK